MFKLKQKVKWNQIDVQVDNLSDGQFGSFQIGDQTDVQIDAQIEIKEADFQFDVQTTLQTDVQIESYHEKVYRGKVAFQS